MTDPPRIEMTPRTRRMLRELTGNDAFEHPDYSWVERNMENARMERARAIGRALSGLGQALVRAGRRLAGAAAGTQRRGAQ